MILSALWFTITITVMNAHNHEIVMMVDNSLRLTESECIEQQTAISDLFKDYKSLPLNEVSYISFNHYTSNIQPLIAFKDSQNDEKSIKHLASKIKTFDCNQHVSSKTKNINYLNDSLLNTFKYAISSYTNYSKTKRILLFNNFAANTKSQNDICKYFTDNNKQNLFVPTESNVPMGIVSINIMGHGINDTYLNCDQRYIKKHITLQNTSVNTFKEYNETIIYSVCAPINCDDCIRYCAYDDNGDGNGFGCESSGFDECDIVTRCAVEGALGGPICCGGGILNSCCERTSNTGNWWDDAVTCTPTPVQDFCCIQPTTAIPTTPSPTKDESDDSNENAAMNDVNMFDGLNENNKINGQKSETVKIKFDSLTTGTMWIIIGMLTFCVILMCCLYKRKAIKTQYESNTM